MPIKNHERSSVMNRHADEIKNNPLKLLEDDHCWQLVLCDGLEQIADSLPQDIDTRLASLASEALKKAIRQHNLFEEVVLFPRLLMRIDQDSNLRNAFSQLQQEHETDCEHAFELSQELDRVVIERHVHNPEMLGYMLRGFFDALRRHINWENQTVLPLALQLLTAEDLKAMSAWIANNPESVRCSRLLKIIGKHLGFTECPYRLEDFFASSSTRQSKPTGIPINDNIADKRERDSQRDEK